MNAHTQIINLQNSPERLRWQQVVDKLNEPNFDFKASFSPSFRYYFSIGQKVTPSTPCINVDRAEGKKLPRIRVGMEPGKTGLCISVRTLLYLGHTGRAVIMKQVPVCGNKWCINPAHQTEWRLMMDDPNQAKAPPDPEELNIIEEAHLAPTCDDI